jgi:hypothetical protein
VQIFPLAGTKYGIAIDATASIPDARRVDFRTGLIDHHHQAIAAAIGDIDGDLARHQIGGVPGIAFAFAIRADRIFQPDTVFNIEMKNGH